VIPIVQSAPTPASNGGPTGSISYDLQPQRTAVNQTTMQVMPVQKLQKVSRSVTVVNDQPAVLQTLTIVGE
jgi:hypothetical protein